jgi:hypothetical protein
MASRKDRLSRRIRDEVEKNIGPGESGMSGFVDDVASRREEGTAESESAGDQSGIFARLRRSKKSDGPQDFRVSSEKKRESVYNISGDIRLEDYIDAKEQDSFWRRPGFYRTLGFSAAALLLLSLLWLFFSWIFGPNYKLGIAAVELTEDNIEKYEDTDSLMLGPGRPLHIRFQWEADDLDTDYLKIVISKKMKGDYETEAELGRRPPQTANYIYFYGPLDPGEYRVQVLNRDGDILKKKDITVR